MSNLVHELQRDAANPEVRISSLLRKTLVVASKLKLQDFYDWAKQELAGYQGLETVPPYRVVPVAIKAHNPYHGWIPVLLQNPSVAEKLSKCSVANSVAQLEDQVTSKSRGGFLTMELPHHVRDSIMAEARAPMIPMWIVDGAQVAGILDAIRNTILEWTLRLESEGILGEDMSFSERDISRAAASTSIHIANFQGILGNIENSSVNQTLYLEIRPGDFADLARILESKKVAPEEIEELKVAIRGDPTPEIRDRFGPNVGGWIGKMVGKATTGAWEIGINTAGSLLASLISKYYGM